MECSKRNELTAGRLQRVLEGVPDDIPVKLSSDTGVDQGMGEIVVESAAYIAGEDGWFDIYVNDHCDDMPDCEPLSPEEERLIREIFGEADAVSDREV